MRIYKIFLLAFISFSFLACNSTKDFTDEDYLSFIENILKDIYQGNGTLLNESIDYDVFMSRIQGEYKEFKQKELLEFLQNNFKPGDNMAALIEDGADIRFIRLYREKGEVHAIFRTYYNGSISVEDWEFGQKKGEIKINDAFSIVSGVYWSDDWRMKASNKMNIVNDNTILINQLMEINYMIAQREYQLADSAFYWIEQACIHNLYGRTMQLNLASLYKDYEEVTQMTKDFLKEFPAQKQISEFYLLQSAISHGLIEKTIEHADYLNVNLGSDPVYFVYLSWVYQQANQHEKTQQYLDSAIFYMPQVYDFYHNKLDIYYEDKQYTDFVKQLYVIDQFFAPTEEDIPFFEKTYPEAATTKEFKEWKEAHIQPSLSITTH